MPTTLSEAHTALLETLEKRFHENMKRHEGMEWENVQKELQKQPEKLRALAAMEESGGQPDVVSGMGGKIVFVDCSTESPTGRRNCCYDAEALAARKTHKPPHSAIATAEEMGVELLTEEQYYALQTFGPFDAKTSSWVATPADVRKLGGGLFCDFRFGRVFTYHNGVESYYAARGFRACLSL